LIFRTDLDEASFALAAVGDNADSRLIPEATGIAIASDVSGSFGWRLIEVNDMSFFMAASWRSA